MKSHLDSLASFVLAALFALGASQAFAATVVVTPGNLQSWSLFTTGVFNNVPTPSDGDASLVNGIGTPPLGTGSAHLNPGSDTETSARLRSTGWAGTSLSALTTLKYSTYATATNDVPSGQFTYLTFYIDTDGIAGYDDRWHFEPTYSRAGAGNGNPTPQADPALNVWQTWDLLTGRWYSDNHPGPGSNAMSFASLLALDPTATLVNDGAAGGIRITSGFITGTDPINLYVDNFQIGTAAGTTIYDFEEVPEPSSVATAGLALVGLCGYAIRRRHSRRAA